MSSGQAAQTAQIGAVLSAAGLVGSAAQSGASGDLVGAAVKTGLAGLSGKLASLLGSNEGIFRKDYTEQLSGVINLHMQEAPSVKYGANYNDADLGVLSGLLSMTNSISDAVDQLLDPNKAQDAKAAMFLRGAQIPSAIAGGGRAFEALAGAAFKIKTNPFREVLFESVDYRTFNFRYRFLPKSAQESDNIRRIINTFKFHMHPELTENKFFYIYPSEFEIVYNYRGGPNTFFNRIQNCALTDMTVEYGGDKFATFDNGAPVETILTLTFRELELLTKDALADPETGAVYGY